MAWLPFQKLSNPDICFNPIYNWFLGGKASVEYLSKLYVLSQDGTGFEELRSMWYERQNFGVAQVIINGEVS